MEVNQSTTDSPKLSPTTPSLFVEEHDLDSIRIETIPVNRCDWDINWVDLKINLFFSEKQTPLVYSTLKSIQLTTAAMSTTLPNIAQKQFEIRR